MIYLLRVMQEGGFEPPRSNDAVARFSQLNLISCPLESFQGGNKPSQHEN